MGLTRRTINAGGWKLTGVVIKAVAQLLVLGTLARYIRPEEFGLVAIGQIVIAFGNMFSQVGLGPALIQREGITQVHIRVAFTTSVGLACLVWLVLWGTAPLLGEFFRDGEVIPVIRALGIGFILTSAGLVAESLLARALDFRKIMVAELASYLLGYAATGIGLAIAGFGVWALVGANLTQRALHSTLCFAFQRHSIVPSVRRREILDLATFGSGLTLSRFFHLVGNYGDNAAIGRLLGASALGIYGRAFQLMSVPVQHLGDVIDSVMFPAMSRIQGEKAKLGEVYLRAIGLINLVLLPASVVGVILAPEIVRVVLGAGWEEAIVPLQLLTAAASFKGSIRMCDSLVRAVGAVFQSAARKAIYAGAIIFGVWAGHFWGLNGVAWGVGAAVLLTYILMLHLSLSLVGRGWGELFGALVPGGRLAVIAVLAVLPLTVLMRSLDLQAVIVLPVGATVGVGVLLALIVASPALLGGAGRWMLGHLLDLVPARNTLVMKLRKSVQQI